MDNNQELTAKINVLEEHYAAQFVLVFEAIKSLLNTKENPPGSNEPPGGSNRLSMGFGP